MNKCTSAKRWRKGLERWLIVMAGIIACGSVGGAEVRQQTFPTPEAGVAALIEAAGKNDLTALTAILGPNSKQLVVTRDPATDRVNRGKFASAAKEFHVLRESTETRRELVVGYDAWPFPIPLVREAGSWRFATEQGAQELINRRIGANERNAIAVLRAYVDAQRQYAARDRNGDGVLEYAQRIRSTAGKKDGLYWEADEAKGEESSPFGPLVTDGAAYHKGRKADDPYRGYYFKILTRQVAGAPGGAYSYLINGRMIAGFAMLAFPAEYRSTGVMSFIVNHNGKVYEKDLGRDSATIGAGMRDFSPTGWREVTD